MRRFVRLLLGCAALGGTLVGCGPGESTGAALAPPPASASAVSPATLAPRAAPADVDRPTVVFLGDSLTAGFGLGEEEAFPALLERRFAASGRSVRVVNAGVSGDTSAGGLARVDWMLRLAPDLVVVELGANDGLRGQPLASVRANLAAIIERCRATGAEVLLVGMLIPPNYGPEYTTGFANLYRDLAREHDLPLVPFLLEGVAARPELNLADGIHPNAAGHARVAEHLWPFVEPLVAALAARGSEATRATG